MKFDVCCHMAIEKPLWSLQTISTLQGHVCKATVSGNGQDLGLDCGEGALCATQEVQNGVNQPIHLNAMFLFS